MVTMADVVSDSPSLVVVIIIPCIAVTIFHTFSSYLRAVFLPLWWNLCYSLSPGSYYTVNNINSLPLDPSPQKCASCHPGGKLAGLDCYLGWGWNALLNQVSEKYNWGWGKYWNRISGWWMLDDVGGQHHLEVLPFGGQCGGKQLKWLWLLFFIDGFVSIFKYLVVNLILPYAEGSGTIASIFWKAKR